MLRVGLTGGIASGKSHVLRRLEARGCHTLDLDSASREVMAPGGAAYADVVAAFGPEVVGPDGALDRARLGRLVFGDPAARARLNALVHPRIRDVEQAFGARFDRAGDVVVVDGALLVEVGMHLRFDRLVVVHCRPELQLARLMARDGLDLAEARARLAAQMPPEQKRALAHFDIDSSGTPADTEAAADEVAAALARLAWIRPTPVHLPRARLARALAVGGRPGPRGLAPWRWLAAFGAERGLELAGLARLAGAPEGRPWYLADLPQPGEPGPEALALALTAWCLARRGDDRDYVLSAAASLARLLDPRAEAVGRSCAAAWLAFDVALGGAERARQALQSSGWSAAVGRWGPPPPRAPLLALVDLLERAADPESVRERAQAAGAAADLAAALHAFLHEGGGEAPAEVEAALDAFCAPAGPDS